MNLYEDQFSERHDFPRMDAPAKILVIASTGRCGSHMLGHALHTTGKFGFPLEYANPANLSEWQRKFDVQQLPDVLTELQRRRTSANGVFSIKIHYPHLKQFGGFGKLEQLFPDAYYLLLSRSDVLNQAVSLSIASQTGVWISGQKPIRTDPTYCHAEIDACLRETLLNNASWRYTLAASGANYMEMDFNDFRYNLKAGIKDIARFMGVEVAEADLPEQPVTEKQSNERSAEWVARFASEFDRSSHLLSHVGQKPRLSFRIRRKIKKKLGI